MLIEVLIPEANNRYSFCKYLAASKRPYKVVAVLEKCVIFRVRTCIFGDEISRLAQCAGITEKSICNVCFNDEGLRWSKELLDPALRNYSWK